MQLGARIIAVNSFKILTLKSWNVEGNQPSRRCQIITYIHVHVCGSCHACNRKCHQMRFIGTLLTGHLLPVVKTAINCSQFSLSGKQDQRAAKEYSLVKENA